MIEFFMENNIDFNKTRYIQLLKKEKELLDLGFNKNAKEYRELLSYQIILENQVHYNNKSDYIFLLQEYLEYYNENTDEKGAGEGLFLWEFNTLFHADTKSLSVLEKEILEQGIDRLNTFSIDPKSPEFSDLIHDIFNICEALNPEAEDRSEITFDEFRKYMEEIFFEIQKCLDE